MSVIQTLIFAVVQGLTELFPISSVAHGVLTPYFLHWNLSPEFLKEHFLPFVVMLHLGTATALLLYFGTEWISIIASLFSKQNNEARKLLFLIIVGTFPAALIGLILEHPIRHLFSNVTNAAIFLIINGFLLYWGEKMRNKGQRNIRDLNYKQAAVIGLFQSLALIPGFSRSGATMTAGFWAGLKHEESARFSMLLATPIIAGAGVLEVPKLLHAGLGNLFQISLLGGVASGIAAFLSVWILMKWFRVNEVTAMRPFAWYCWILGAGILISQFI
ncbi:undecaprenyl-diphosphatase uppp [Lucifera butyrica]|uniref:Undecaprenyl-diphosphatase n=1 Tax=Lucifera butyrica TaxID=1351585 RepID=A0A498RAP8_9FIRM|nr:undecaprenyl-diphosphate phosphatase [Lucifera butyrica]VBB08279.1 undecaprenyl-diphosphatase uppp [Lucifera butyrica]